MLNDQPVRRQWMRVLALSEWKDLQPLAASQDAASFLALREPETGIVMLRGRAGGSGGAFNLGEATVTRCAVKSPAGHVGHAYVMGNNHAHARAAALFDALMQDEGQRDALQERVITPLAAKIESRRLLAAAKAAATKVDFFTLVRGESD